MVVRVICEDKSDKTTSSSTSSRQLQHQPSIQLAEDKGTYIGITHDLLDICGAHWFANNGITDYGCLAPTSPMRKRYVPEFFLCECYLLWIIR